MSEPRPYVYGVVRAGAPVPAAERTVGTGPIELVRHGDVAAIVSEFDGDWVEATRARLLAHTAIADTLVDDGHTVLPMQFGVLVEDRRTLIDSFLEPRHAELVTLLGELDGSAELRVEARYRGDAAVRDAVGVVPAISELQSQIRRRSETSTHFMRIRLGELVAEGLEVVQRRDRQAIDQALGRAARAVVALTATPIEELASRTALLVERGRLPDVERTVEDLATCHAERLQFRLLGPMAPWDFVALPPVPAAQRTGTR